MKGKNESAAVRVRKDEERARDAFLTLPTVASALVSEVLVPYLEKNGGLPDFFVEPSAGAGAFLDALPSGAKFEAIDIEPKDARVKRHDFMEWKCPEGRAVVIGNPPFGKNSSLAIKFVNRSATFANVIAMILPRTFRKESVLHRLSPHLDVVVDVDVEKDAFVFKGETYDVPCCFMIFARRHHPKSREKGGLTCHDFDFVGKDEGEVSFQRVGVNAGWSNRFWLLRFFLCRTTSLLHL